MLTDLRIVLEPYCEESDIELRWTIPDELPLVQADRHSLLQVLLNVTKNSQRALEPVARKAIDISVLSGAAGVSIRIADSGPGISPGRTVSTFTERRGRHRTGTYTCRAPLCDRFGETCGMTRITPAVVLCWS